MIFMRFKPSLQLQEYIREYVIVHLIFDAEISIPPKAYPVNPEEGIRFIIEGQLFSQDPEWNTTRERPVITILGQPTRRQNLIVSRRYCMFHIRFQPGSLFKLFKIPMTELLNQNYDAELVIGKEIREIHEQLLYAPDYEQMIHLVNKYFEGKVNQIKPRYSPVDKIGQCILENPESFNLDKAAKQACLSIRQFEKRFEQLIGTTPKYYMRLCRFYQAYEMKEYNPDLDWLSVAIRSGYNDYQPLVKDFKQFAGTTPTILIKESERNPERILNLAPVLRGV